MVNPHHRICIHVLQDMVLLTVLPDLLYLTSSVLVAVSVILCLFPLVAASLPHYSPTAQFHPDSPRYLLTYPRSTFGGYSTVAIDFVELCPLRSPLFVTTGGRVLDYISPFLYLQFTPLDLVIPCAGLTFGFIHLLLLISGKEECLQFILEKRQRPLTFQVGWVGTFYTYADPGLCSPPSQPHSLLWVILVGSDCWRFPPNSELTRFLVPN